ncbi:retrovirus-related Pol polyprotein from transposon 412 [Trichonephila clavipes]|nr:retrovirus-related Pol polyprotein from transposon 412 [Trichonephila clavipes]
MCRLKGRIKVDVTVQDWLLRHHPTANTSTELSSLADVISCDSVGLVVNKLSPCAWFQIHRFMSAVHETTGYSPSQMLFGRDLRLPADLLFSQPLNIPLVPEENVEKVQVQMEEIHHLARERIGMASEKMKTRYDARATGHDFHEGNKVWLWNSKCHKELSPMLQTNWEDSQRRGSTPGFGLDNLDSSSKQSMPASNSLCQLEQPLMMRKTSTSPSVQPSALQVFSQFPVSSHVGPPPSDKQIGFSRPPVENETTIFSVKSCPVSEEFAGNHQPERTEIPPISNTAFSQDFYSNQSSNPAFCPVTICSNLWDAQLAIPKDLDWRQVWGSGRPRKGSNSAETVL